MRAVVPWLLVAPLLVGFAGAGASAAAAKEYTITVRDGAAEFVVHGGTLDDPVLAQARAAVPEGVWQGLLSGASAVDREAGRPQRGPFCVGSFTSRLDIRLGDGEGSWTGSGCGDPAGTAIEAYIGPVKRLFDVGLLLGPNRLAPDEGL